MTSISDIEREFDKRVNNLRRDDGSEKVLSFGYKVKRDDELFTITDWGNIKAYYRPKIKKLLEEMVLKCPLEKIMSHNESGCCYCDARGEQLKTLKRLTK